MLNNWNKSLFVYLKEYICPVMNKILACLVSNCFTVNYLLILLCFIVWSVILVHGLYCVSTESHFESENQHLQMNLWVKMGYYCCDMHMPGNKSGRKGLSRNRDAIHFLHVRKKGLVLKSLCLKWLPHYSVACPRPPGGHRGNMDEQRMKCSGTKNSSINKFISLCAVSSWMELGYSGN